MRLLDCSTVLPCPGGGKEGIKPVGSLSSLWRRVAILYRAQAGMITRLWAASTQAHTQAQRRLTCRPRRTIASFGLVLDIDGVLIRGGAALPPAQQFLNELSRTQTSSAVKRRVPYIFVTNGGGVLESVKTREINLKLFPGLPNPVVESQVLLSHTPMKSLVPEYKDRPVLAVGSKDYVGVATGYGLTKVVTVEDILHAHPEIYHFRRTEYRPRRYEEEPIAAVMVLYDPTDWAVEIQVLCDIINGGVVPDGTERGINQIPVFSSNSDLIFSSSFPAPRLAQGAFLEAWDHVWRTAYRGPPLKFHRFGKPQASTYRYAELMLLRECQRLGFMTDVVDVKETQPYPLKRVYAIGDNPAADVQGANAASGHMCEWVSILVRTGVFKGENDSEHPAKYVVDDVLEAWKLIQRLEAAAAA